MIAKLGTSHKTKGLKIAQKHADNPVVTEYAIILASVTVTVLVVASSLGGKVAEVFTAASGLVP
jgi:hypothetical protein